MSILFYVLGALLRVGMTIIDVPLAVLGGLLSLPVLSTVWGTWVWFCGLLGDAGTMLLTATRVLLNVGVVYLPIFIIRHFSFRRAGTQKAQ